MAHAGPFTETLTDSPKSAVLQAFQVRGACPRDRARYSLDVLSLASATVKDRLVGQGDMPGERDVVTTVLGLLLGWAVYKVATTRQCPVCHKGVPKDQQWCPHCSSFVGSSR